MKDNSETLALPHMSSISRPTPERIEEVAKNYLHGNEDPEFEFEVLDISPVVVGGNFEKPQNLVYKTV